MENFQAEQDAQKKEFSKIEDKACFPFSIIKRQLFEAGDSEMKIDGGPIKEVLAERKKQVAPSSWKEGRILSPLALLAPIERASEKLQDPRPHNNGLTPGGDLVQETVAPRIVENLFSQSWSSRIGATFIENFRGTIYCLREKDKPDNVGWSAEGTDFGESSLTYEDAFTLQPKRIGSIVELSYQMFLQDQTRQLEASISRQLMKAFAEQFDTDALTADGTANKPKGILAQRAFRRWTPEAALTDQLFLIPSSRTREGLIEAENFSEPVSWIINSKRQRQRERSSETM